MSNKKKVQQQKKEAPVPEVLQSKVNSKKVFIVTQHDLVTGQKARAGVFDSEQKARDYCSGLDVKNNNYTVEDAEVE